MYLLIADHITYHPSKPTLNRCDAAADEKIMNTNEADLASATLFPFLATGCRAKLHPSPATGTEAAVGQELPIHSAVV